VIDLGATSAPSRRTFKQHSTVPVLRGTNARPAPGSRRSISAETRTSNGTNQALLSGKPVDTSSRWRARAVTRDDILGRYRGTSKAGADADPAMLSKSRRTVGRNEQPSLSNARGPVKVAETRATAKPAPSKTRSTAKPTGRDTAWLRSKDPAATSMRDLPSKNPELARKIKAGGELTSRAIDVGVRTAIDVAIPFGGPNVVANLGTFSGGTTYDDGYDDGYGDGYGDGFYDGSLWTGGCGGPYYGGWGAGYWGSGLGLCWSWGWGFNYAWNIGWNSCWYSAYGSYWSPWRRSSIWCPRPYYNSTVIYERLIYRDRYEDEVEGGYDTYEDAPAAQGDAVAEAPAPMDLVQTMNRAADYYLVLGDRAFREGRYGDAVHFYAKAVEFSGDEGILYLILSDALFATGDYHYAAFALRKAIELDPEIIASVIDKHSFYNDPKDFDRQLAVLEGYVEDHFINNDARLVLAANYLFGGRPAAAVDLLENRFSLDVRESPAGNAILEAAKAIQHGAPK